MEDIKLWELDGTQAKSLESNNQLESEHLLEETLVKNPNLLMEDLTLVGRQTPAGGGALDLLGVDQDGRLVVFELKRGKLSRDAVAQIIDYASGLDAMDLDALAEHISENSGVGGIDEIKNFQEWYDIRGFDDLGSLKPLRMFLVGLGADDTTERMVKFLAQNSGMDISMLTFHAFDYHGKTILAKQVEVEAATEPDRRPTRRYVSVAERWAQLERQVEDSAVPELFLQSRTTFRENWQEIREVPTMYGLSFRLPNLTGTGGPAAYARIDPEDQRVRIVFYPRAITLSEDKFGQLVEDVPYETWPPNRQPLEDPNTELQFVLNVEEWETHKESLTALVRSIYTAWQNESQDDGADSA